MKTIKFNPNGGSLTVKAIFKGKMVANYEMFLREKESNNQTTLLKGDNTNPEDDKIDLPVPVGNNDGRRAVLETGFYGLDPATNPNYEIRFEIFQDGALLDFENETGVLIGKGQYSLLFVKLII